MINAINLVNLAALAEISEKEFIGSLTPALEPAFDLTSNPWIKNKTNFFTAANIFVGLRSLGDAVNNCRAGSSVNGVNHLPVFLPYTKSSNGFRWLM